MNPSKVTEKHQQRVVSETEKKQFICKDTHTYRQTPLPLHTYIKAHTHTHTHTHTFTVKRNTFFFLINPTKQANEASEVGRLRD